MKKKLITFGQINKNLLYIFLMSVSCVLNKYIYGFTYIECFYPMNIYRILHNWILNKNDECPLHRVFDPFFSYIGIIFISLIFLREKNVNDKNETVKNIEEKKHWKTLTLIKKLIMETF